jgi:DNA invertase Pin-like site-specific DNA recombinase
MAPTMTTACGLLPAVGYLRRSTDRQEQSIGDQRKAIDRYAQEHGFDILHYYIDDAISGTTSEQRKAFQELMTDAKERDCPFKYVLVYDVKRFGRLDNDEAGHYRFTLRMRGIEIIYTAEAFTGDDTDDLLRPVKQWQARQESKDLSLVTIRGQLSRVNEGLWNGGTPPYGYDLAYYTSAGMVRTIVRYQPDGTKLLLNAQGEVTSVVGHGESLNNSKADRCKLTPSDPERVETIRNIFTWYTRDGLGFKGIADRLNAMGISSPRGGTWSRYHGADWSMTTIRDILLNPAYVGDMVWNRLSFAKFHKIAGGKAVRRHSIPGGGAEQNREADWIVIPDAHPALITREQFDLARVKREDRRKSHSGQSFRVGQGAKSSYLLTGLIQCDRCGHYWQGYSVNKGKPRKDGSKVKTYYYACNGYVSKGNAVCHRSVIAQEALESWVLDQIDDIIQRYVREGGEEELRTMIRQELTVTATREQTESGLTLEAIATRKQAITQQVNATLRTIDEANREFVNAHLTTLREEMAELTRQEEAIHRQAAQHEMLDEAVDSQYSLACQRIGMARNVLLAGTIEEQRLIIRAFLRRIRFDPDTRTGTAEFWLIPGTGNEDPRRNPAGRGRRTDLHGDMEHTSTAGDSDCQVVEQRLIAIG